MDAAEVCPEVALDTVLAPKEPNVARVPDGWGEQKKKISRRAVLAGAAGVAGVAASDALTRPAHRMHRRLAGAANAVDVTTVDTTNVVTFGADPTGVADSTTAIRNAIAGAYGAVYYPSGTYKVSGTLTSTLPLRHYGDSPMSSWIVPTSALGSSPVFDIQLPSTSNYSTYDTTGAQVIDLGFNLTAAPNCTGIYIEQYSQWCRIEHVFMEGGAISIHNQGQNNWLEDLILYDAGTCYLLVDAGSNGITGLELTVRDVTMERWSTGTTVVGIDVEAASPTTGGALYLQDVRIGTDPISGIQTNGGIKMAYTGPLNTGAANSHGLSVPLFAEKVIIDSVVGGNPGLTLYNVSDIQFSNGWINCGASTGGPCVRITGGERIGFAHNKFFGGANGGTAKTYDFVGSGTAAACTHGFVSEGNHCPTNWVYYLPTSGFAPTEMSLNDYVVNGTPGLAVSNNMAQLQTSAMTRFGPQYWSDKFTMRQAVLPDSVSSFFTTLNHGISPVISAPLVSSSLSHLVPYYFSPSGTIGALSVRTITNGTSFQIQSLQPNLSVQTGDNSTIGVLMFFRG